jgi:hypothetical protein
MAQGVSDRISIESHVGDHTEVVSKHWRCRMCAIAMWAGMRSVVMPCCDRSMCVYSQGTSRARPAQTSAKHRHPFMS